MTSSASFTDLRDIDAVAAVAAAAAADLDLIARLHDREPDAALVGALAERPATDWLSLRLDGDGLATGLVLMSRALDELGRPPSQPALNQLAAAYADIYLTHGLRLAPTSRSGSQKTGSNGRSRCSKYAAGMPDMASQRLTGACAPTTIWCMNCSSSQG